MRNHHYIFDESNGAMMYKPYQPGTSIDFDDWAENLGCFDHYGRGAAEKLEDGIATKLQAAAGSRDLLKAKFAEGMTTVIKTMLKASPPDLWLDWENDARADPATLYVELPFAKDHGNNCVFAYPLSEVVRHNYILDGDHMDHVKVVARARAFAARLRQIADQLDVDITQWGKDAAVAAAQRRDLA